MRDLEGRFVDETDRGILRLLGRRAFQCIQPRASIDSPEKVEIGTPLKMSWEGPYLAGDHITISGKDEATPTDHVCILAASGGPARLAQASLRPQGEGRRQGAGGRVRDLPVRLSASPRASAAPGQGGGKVTDP